MQQIYWLSHLQSVKLSSTDQTCFLYLQQSFTATGWLQAIRVIPTTMMTLPGVWLPTGLASGNFQHPPLPSSCHGLAPKILEDGKGEYSFLSLLMLSVTPNNMVPNCPLIPTPAHCFQAVSSQGSLGGPKRTHVFFSKRPCGKPPLSYVVKGWSVPFHSLFLMPCPGPGTWLTTFL